MSVGFFSQVTSDRTRRNGLKSLQGKFRLGIWKKFCKCCQAFEQAAQGSGELIVPGSI